MNQADKRIYLMVIGLFSIATAPSAVANDQCKPALHSKIPIKAEGVYSKQRKLLLVAGWQPVSTVSWQEKDKRLFGQAKYFWEKGFTEVIGCAGTGSAPCSFLFTDVYGNKLVVDTSGEEVPDQNMYARIYSFHFDCDLPSTDNTAPKQAVRPNAQHLELFEYSVKYLAGNESLRYLKNSECGYGLREAPLNYFYLINNEFLPAFPPELRNQISKEFSQLLPEGMPVIHKVVQDLIMQSKSEYQQETACNLVVRIILNRKNTSLLEWQSKKQKYGYY